MTDDALRDLVLKHDASISQLVSSIEHLTRVQSNMSAEIKESNQQIKELMKYLAKQQVFGTQLDNIDRDAKESFMRVHKRVDELDTIQKSDTGCKSVQLLTKDVESNTREVTRLVSITEENRIRIESIEKASIGTGVKVAIVSLIITYTVGFGVYVVNSIGSLGRTDEKVLTLLNELEKQDRYILGRLRKE